MIRVGVAVVMMILVGGWTRVIDGDTIDVDGERIRLINIDTPETWKPRCADEYAVGVLAKERLRELLRGPGVLTIVREGKDYWRRTLAYVLVDETDVGDVLISEGLALPWKSGPKAKAARLREWCPGS